MEMHGKRRGGFSDRSYLGTCTVCKNGIFKGDDHGRAGGIYLGMVHRPCIEKVSNVEAGQGQQA